MPERRPRLISIIGARPEIIQAAPVSAALAPLAEEILVHTGQHYDDRMSEAQIHDTALPRPRYNLGVGSRGREEQVELAQSRLADVIAEERPDAIIVRGDTNKHIARRYDIAEATVKVHVKAILRKIGVQNRTQAAIWALSQDRPHALPGPAPRHSRTASGVLTGDEVNGFSGPEPRCTPH